MSGGCLEGAWEVSESKMIFLGEEKKNCPTKLKMKLFTKAKLSLYIFVFPGPVVAQTYFSHC